LKGAPLVPVPDGRRSSHPGIGGQSVSGGRTGCWSVQGKGRSAEGTSDSGYRWTGEMSIVNLSLSPDKRPVLAAALGFSIRGDGLCREGASPATICHRRGIRWLLDGEIGGVARRQSHGGLAIDAGCRRRLPPRVPGTVGSVGEAESRGSSRAVLAQGSAVVTRPLDAIRGLDQPQPSLVNTTVRVIFSGKAYHSRTV